MGMSLIQTGRWQSERALWTDTLLVDPKNARAHHNLGILDQKELALDDAEMHFRKALSLSPLLYESRLYLGITLGQKGNLDAAKKEFEEMLRAKPHWRSQGHYHLGLNAMYRNDFSKALEHFEKVTELAPHTGLGHRGKALAYTKMGKKDLATQAWAIYSKAPKLSSKERKKAEEEIQALAQN